MKNLKRLIFWSAATIVMTVIHHFYGAIVYDEPFRMHVAVFAIPVFVILISSYVAYLKAEDTGLRKFSLLLLLGTSLLFSVVAIGLYEGGFNHAVKNILYFGGVSVATLDRIYPSIYELPNDILFETTGVMQLVTGLLCGWEMFIVFTRYRFTTLVGPVSR